MTDLERFAAVLLAEWSNDSGRPSATFSTADLLDRVMPYRVARRALAIDTAEDYELLVLRLVSEEAAIVTTDPREAAEMARTTLASRIPDLDVLQLLRSARMTFTDDAISRLEGVRPLPPTSAEPPAAASYPGADVLPIRRVPEAADHTATATPSMASDEPPPAFLTKVAFTPPDLSCWQCGTALPGGRTVKFCVECGADQRKPRCNSCGTDVEPTWKHCAECGAQLRS